MTNHRLPNRLPLKIATGVCVVGLLTVGVLKSPLVTQLQAQVELLRMVPGTDQPDSTKGDQVSLTAIPPRLGDDGSLTIKPGEKKQITLKVRNSSQKTLSIESLVSDFVMSEDGETPVALTESVSNRWSLASWMTVSPSGQVLAPNELALVNVVIEAPADALPGGHYAMVTHQPKLPSLKDANGQAPSQTGISQRVGTLLYVTVDGPINEEAFVRNLTFPNLSEFGPVPFSFTVDNASDVHIRPQVTLEVFNLFGQRVDTLQIESKNVFPLLSRDFSGTWPKIWGTGRYTAKLTMSYGTTGKVVVTQTSFWLLPYKLVLAGGIVLLVLLALTIIIRRHLLHRQAETEAELKAMQDKLATLEKQTSSKPEQ